MPTPSHSTTTHKNHSHDGSPPTTRGSSDQQPPTSNKSKIKLPGRILTAAQKVKECARKSPVLDRPVACIRAVIANAADRGVSPRSGTGETKVHRGRWPASSATRPAGSSGALLISNGKHVPSSSSPSHVPEHDHASNRREDPSNHGRAPSRPGSRGASSTRYAGSDESANHSRPVSVRSDISAPTQRSTYHPPSQGSTNFPPNVSDNARRSPTHAYNEYPQATYFDEDFGLTESPEASNVHLPVQDHPTESHRGSGSEAGDHQTYPNLVHRPRRRQPREMTGATKQSTLPQYATLDDHDQEAILDDQRRPPPGYDESTEPRRKDQDSSYTLPNGHRTSRPLSSGPSGSRSGSRKRTEYHGDQKK